MRFFFAALAAFLMFLRAAFFCLDEATAEKLYLAPSSFSAISRCSFITGTVSLMNSSGPRSSLRSSVVPF